MMRICQKATSNDRRHDGPSHGSSKRSTAPQFVKINPTNFNSFPTAHDSETKHER